MAISVLQVIGDGRMGGGTTAVLQLASGLRRHGISVNIATQQGTELVGTARSLGIAVHELDFSRRAASLFTSRRLQTVIREARPSIVHAHGARAGLPCALLPRALGPAIAYTVHGFHYGNKAPGIRTFARWSEWLCIAAAQAVVFVSQSDAALASKDGLLGGTTAGHVIYNGAAPPHTDGKPSLPDHDVAFIGRLHHQKNPLLLAEIARLAPTLRFLIIGDGELGGALRQRVRDLSLQDRFTFLGSLSHAEALRALPRARCMVLPSLWEGLPMAVIEAMHLGLPVVATDMPGLREMVVENVTGHLVPSGDAALFAEKLSGLAADRARSNAMHGAAKSRAAHLFSLDQQIDQHVALYRGMVATATSRIAEFAA